MKTGVGVSNSAVGSGIKAGVEVAGAAGAVHVIAIEVEAGTREAHAAAATADITVEVLPAVVVRVEAAIEVGARYLRGHVGGARQPHSSVSGRTMPLTTAVPVHCVKSIRSTGQNQRSGCREQAASTCLANSSRKRRRLRSFTAFDCKMSTLLRDWDEGVQYET